MPVRREGRRAKRTKVNNNRKGRVALQKDRLKIGPCRINAFSSKGQDSFGQEKSPCDLSFVNALGKW
jgi:hypothetical protein